MAYPGDATRGPIEAERDEESEKPVEHGFPGGPPHPPYGPPLRGETADGAANDPLADGPPRGEASPTSRVGDEAAPLLPAPPAAGTPLPPSAAPSAGGQLDQEITGASAPAATDAATPGRVVGGVARDVPTFAQVLEAEGGRPRPAARRPRPPPQELTLPRPPVAVTPRATRPPGPGPVARLRRALKLTAYGIAGLVGLLLLIGVLVGEETVDGASEGEFAAVDPAVCRELVISGSDRFAAGADTTAGLEGTGIGAPIWAAPVGGDDLEARTAVAVAGDGGDLVTVAFMATDADGGTTTHAATYDIAAGDLVDQLHLRAAPVGSVPGARWHIGAQEATALLFPVVGTDIPACFAASAAPGAPAPPLTYEVGGRLQPFADASGHTAVTEEGLLVPRRDPNDGTVQWLSPDGQVDAHVIEGAEAVFADDEHAYVLSWTLDGEHLSAHDPRTMVQRWDVDLADGPDLLSPTFASDGTVVTMASSTGRRRLVRVAAADGTLLPGGEARLSAVTGGSDGTVAYLVDPYPQDSRKPVVLALAPEDDAIPTDLAPSGLVPGVAVGSRIPDALLVSGPADGVGTRGLVLRGGEVVASAEAALLGLGSGHVIAMLRLPGGAQVLLGVPLEDAADGGDGSDGEDGGDEAGDDAAAEEDAGEGEGDGGGDGNDGGAGGGGGSGGDHEVTDGEDIDEGWLP